METIWKLYENAWKLYGNYMERMWKGCGKDAEMK